MTIGDVIASLHTTRPGCIACNVCNAGIAHIARNDCNNCNDEVTFKDGRHATWSGHGGRVPEVYADDRGVTAGTFTQFHLAQASGLLESSSRHTINNPR